MIFRQTLIPLSHDIALLNFIKLVLSMLIVMDDGIVLSFSVFSKIPGGN